jgi:hypothetical protein
VSRATLWLLDSGLTDGEIRDACEHAQRVLHERDITPEAGYAASLAAADNAPYDRLAYYAWDDAERAALFSAEMRDSAVLVLEERS